MNGSCWQLALVFSCSIVFSVFADEPENCIKCHAEAVSDWQQSDHAKAMSIATPKTVLGDFNNSEAGQFPQKALFYRDNEKFKVRLTEDNQTTNYTISYTFGHYPLQQYLIVADSGRFQVFPFAWDSRAKEQGGQRWYAVYNEHLQTTDRLHWQQPLQNWNGMCADCHSDGFKRNYSIDNNAFDSEWDNINVGCQSCHGKMQSHDKGAKKTVELGWVRKEGEAVATWRGEPKDNQVMDTCFSCHSLRAPLADGFDQNVKFLDQFSPTFLTPDLYHADGQIKEEVYLYGSFLQSKMYAAGVGCQDCHDVHTMQVKAQGNNLCLKCHNPENYQTEKHSFHSLESDGGQCVSCHMPETRFMGVDDRRDHSFVVPKPHLAKQYNTPYACTNCHQDKGNDWAVRNLEKWYGKPEALERGEQLYLNLQKVQSLPIEQHFALITDANISEIKRASVVSMLPLSTQRLNDKQVSGLINSQDPLVRLAIARVGFLLPKEERAKSYLSLLQDEYKAIRVAAANQLLGTGLEATTGFDRAFEELTLANSVTSWRGEGNLNRSEVYAKQGKLERSIEALQQAIKVDPYFDVAYINLLDIYRQLGQTENETKTYNTGLKANPKSSMLHYVKGLSLIRRGDKHASVASLSRAVELDVTNPQFAYLYFLALDSTGKTHEALTELSTVIDRYGVDKKLGTLGLNFAKKLRMKAGTDFFTAYLKGQ